MVFTNTEAYALHEVVYIFPEMSGPEFRALQADIEANGQQESIKLWNNQVIDGRHRQNACINLGIAGKYEEIQSQVDDPLTYVVSANKHRRHLSEAQKAAVAAEIITYRENHPLLVANAQYKRRVQVAEFLDAQPTENTRVIARDLGVSLKTISRDIQAIEEGAIDYPPMPAPCTRSHG